MNFQGETASLIAKGQSMNPIIKEGNMIVVSKAATDFELGDIIVCAIDDELGCHRIVRVLKKQKLFLTKGDNRLTLDKAHRKEDVIGRVLFILDSEFIINMNDPYIRKISRSIACCSHLFSNYISGINKVFPKNLLKQLNTISHRIQQKINSGYRKKIDKISLTGSVQNEGRKKG